MYQNDVFIRRSRIYRPHFETEKALGIYFVQCDTNDVRIPHALCIEKKIACTTSSVSEKGDMDSENHKYVVW